MPKTFKALAAASSALALLCLCACETVLFSSSIPEGIPPPGEIIKEIKDKPELATPDRAVNKLSTALTMKLVAIPSSRRPPFISLRSSAEDDGGLGETLLKSLEKSKVARIQPEGSLKGPDFVISSALDRAAGRWAVSLLSPDGSAKLLWADSADIDVSSLEAAR